MREGNENSCRDEINDIVRRAENVCFIGFAFAPENLSLFEASSFEGKTTIATSLGIAPNRKSEVQKRLKRTRFFDASAVDLLNSHNIFESRGAAVKIDQIPVRRVRSDFVRSAMTNPSSQRTI